MPVEPTTENLLTVASYGITGRITQLIEVLRLLDELHGPRKLDAGDLAGSDVRCKTCRNSSGKPCPWPCVTWLRFAEVLDLAGQGLVKHTVTRVSLDDVNDNLDALARGDIVGRAVIVFD